jgi:hypothetical protein
MNNISTVPNKKTTINEYNEYIQNNPSSSIRKAAIDLGVAKSTIQLWKKSISTPVGTKPLEKSVPIITTSTSIDSELLQPYLDGGNNEDQ